jgi:hypothetical protein
MYHKPLLAAGLALALTACVEGGLPEPEPDPNACGAAELQFLVGQNRAVLAAMTLPAPVRVIEPGMAVTMDYSAERLNIDLDDEDRITRVYCG